MSTPFGVDLGNNNTVIGCARNRGIDILVNEVSNRATPTLVGFGPKCRFIGESAKNQQTSNLRNTVGCLKRILGLNYNDPDFAIEQKFFSCPLVENKAGGISAVVNFKNEKHEYTATQLTAMFINKIKDTSYKETKANLQDICLSVPAWYTEKQRRAAGDACRIAGLNPVRIVNEVTAAAVGYGVFKANELPEDKPKNVAFIDIGDSSYQVCIAAVKRGELKVLGTAYDKHFGGRDFDLAIAEHFAEEFKTKYKIDVRSNPKAYYRVLAAAEKLKKVLSANSQAPFNVESLMDDIDVSSSLSREELENYVKPLLDRVHVPVERALKDAGLDRADIDTIEVIGGCTRVPSLKNKLIEVFGKPLSFTLNQDEAIARGNAFICATHSPTVRVRPFKFEDFNPYSVAYFWDKQQEDEDHLEVFPRGGLFPATKIITLHRQAGSFNIEAKYTNRSELPVGTEDVVARWSIGGIVPDDGESLIATKLKLRNDPSGFYTVESAYTVHEQIVKELVETPEGQTEGKGEDGEDAEPTYREVKKTVKKNDLTISISTAALDEAERSQFFEEENSLVLDDKLVADTEERKNALEEYIYELRGKLEEEWSAFALDEEKQKLQGMLAKAEEWLYDDGYDSTKARYIAKYEELASIGNVVRGRYLSNEEEKKQQFRQKQEAKQAQAMAEKMAAERTKSAEESADKPEASNADDMEVD